MLRYLKRNFIFQLLQHIVDLNLLMLLEIPITIYKPCDPQSDKMVVFFHGGGNDQCLQLLRSTDVGAYCHRMHSQ